MRCKSFIVLFVPTILAPLAVTPIFAQETQTAVSDSKTSALPAPDTASAASDGSGSAAPMPLPPDADPTAPGLTPEQRREAIKTHRAFVRAKVAAAQARVAAAKARFAATKEKFATAQAQADAATEGPSAAAQTSPAKKAIKMRSPDEQAALNDPTTFAPDHEKLNKFSYKAMFKMDAFTALNKALSIQGRTTKPNLTPSESEWFQAIHSGQASKYSFAEAALIASGVDDHNKRKEYTAKIDKLVAAAKAQSDKSKSIVFKADAIMSYILAVPMKNGYDDDTYNLAQVLDTGHFNCTSSVVMFVVIAHGIGLDVGAYVEPSHIVARVPNYDVQTTSGQIYPSTQRLKVIQDEKYNSEQMNKFDPDHPYHEVGDNGILLEIYQNIANNAHDNKQADQAAIGALKEVFLDPANPCAGHDVKVYLLEWFNAATTRKDVTTAAAITKLYREMSRDPAAANDMDKCVVNLKKQLAKR
jgi:hypothetical protein